VYKIGLRFRAAIYFDGRLRSLGTYATAKEAALGFDQAVVEHKRPTTLLNYPDGLPIDDVDYEAITNPKKKRKLLSSNTSGFNGVTKTMGNRFQSQIQFDRQIKHLGSYGTAKEAALAFDRAVTKHRLSPSRLNYPAGLLASNDKDYDQQLMTQTKNTKLPAKNTTGYRGVTKWENRFQAQITVGIRNHKHLGTYETAKEAALAFDRAVVKYKLSSSNFNFPNDYTSSSSSSSDDDNESNVDDQVAAALEPKSSPPAKIFFHRDPMLDRLFAEQQNKIKNEKNGEGGEGSKGSKGSNDDKPCRQCQNARLKVAHTCDRRSRARKVRYGSRK
jgi:hypothetical protein